MQYCSGMGVTFVMEETLGHKYQTGKIMENNFHNGREAEEKRRSHCFSTSCDQLTIKELQGSLQPSRKYLMTDLKTDTQPERTQR